jgi:HPt (histidine-containing phosphotransfer) domain-containing protein
MMKPNTPTIAELPVLELPVLELTVLAEMYGDVSADTVCFALNGFNREAEHFVELLELALAEQHYDDIARLTHNLKSMSALCGALQFAALCTQLGSAVRDQDGTAITALARYVKPCWQDLQQCVRNELTRQEVADD